MKRRPLLHVINFLLPILFFLTLDLSSFFISDHRSEKLGFKVTILLAISVLLLILNEILPAMSNRTPLIGSYQSLDSRILPFIQLISAACLSFLSHSHLQHRDFWPDAAESSGNGSDQLPPGQRSRVPEGTLAQAAGGDQHWEVAGWWASPAELFFFKHGMLCFNPITLVLQQACDFRKGEHRLLVHLQSQREWETGWAAWGRRGKIMFSWWMRYFICYCTCNLFVRSVMSHVLSVMSQVWCHSAVHAVFGLTGASWSITCITQRRKLMMLLLHAHFKMVDLKKKRTEINGPSNWFLQDVVQIQSHFQAGEDSCDSSTVLNWFLQCSQGSSICPWEMTLMCPLWCVCVQVKTIAQSAEPKMLLLIHEQLKELQESVVMHNSYRARGGKFVRWAERINQVFFILYSTTLVVFLLLIFIEWNS